MWIFPEIGKNGLIVEFADEQEELTPEIERKLDEIFNDPDPVAQEMFSPENLPEVIILERKFN